MVKTFLMCLLIVATFATPSFCQVMERIQAADEKARVGLIVDELVANARLTKDKVFDVTWSYTAKFAETSTTGADGGSAYKPRTSGKLHFFMGQNRFWGMRDCPQLNFVHDAYQYTFDSDKARVYKLKNGKIVEVDLFCDYLSSPETDLDIYSDLYYCPPWRKGNVRASPERFQELLASGTWEGIYRIDGENVDEISVKRQRKIKADHPRASADMVYRFRESDGQLMFVGSLMRSVSPQKFGGEEYDMIDESTVDVKYSVIGGFQLPSEVRHRVTMRSVNPDGSPYKDYKPAQIRMVTWKLEKARIVDQFPESLLNISVPASARVTDHCRNRAERAVQRELTETKWGRTHWLVVGGIMCCFGFGMWRYTRSRR